MLFLHELHKVIGLKNFRFRRRISDRMDAGAGRGDDARLLWYASQAMGTGASYNVVTITAIKDGGAWERLALRIQSGDLQGWMRDVDTLRHEVTGKILMPLYWSPLKEVESARSPGRQRGARAHPVHGRYRMAARAA